MPEEAALLILFLRTLQDGKRPGILKFPFQRLVAMKFFCLLLFFSATGFLSKAQSNSPDWKKVGARTKPSSGAAGRKT